MIPVGRIVGVWGLKGHVKIDPLTNFPSPFAPGSRVRLGDQWLEVEDCVWQKDRPYVKFSGIDDPEAARALQWSELKAPEEEIELEDGEYRTQDLMGLSVRTESGEALGTIDEVLHLPAQDVLVVGQTMIPAVKQFILKVDLEQKAITVRLIEGMREA